MRKMPWLMTLPLKTTKSCWKRHLLNPREALLYHPPIFAKLLTLGQDLELLDHLSRLQSA